MKPSHLLAILSLFCTLVFVRASLAEEPDQLVSLTTWEDSSTWAMAEEIQGNPQEMKWKSVSPGEKILYNGAEGKAANLVSKNAWGDVEIDVEFMIPKGSNSGIYLMHRYELQILDSFGRADNDLTVHDCGAIYERWDDSKPKGEKGYEGTRPSTNATSAPGTWQNFHILFRVPRFNAEGKKTENARFIRVEHNGVTIHEDADVTGPTRGAVSNDEVSTAPLSIQGDHGPIAFRKFSVKSKDFK